MRKALLVIDLQNDFLPPNGSLAVPGGDEIVEPIIDFLFSQNWNAVVATQDWHPSNHISFASTHEQEPFSDKLIKNPLGDGRELLHTLWPTHCVQNSWGAQFPTKLQMALEKVEVPIKIVRKGVDPLRETYSCFSDVWGEKASDCADWLRLQGIECVFVVGLAWDFCVKWSALDAVHENFRTFVVGDLCRAVGGTGKEQASAQQETAGQFAATAVQVVGVKDLL